jgi:hypothetical protein
MTPTIKFEGMDAVIRGLNDRIGRMESFSFTGLTVAAQDTLGKAIPLTPIDTGNLRGSSGVSPFRGLSGHKNYVVIYYSASYAPFVHEISKNYRVGGWKFLETALKTNQKRILDIIALYARRGLA